MKDSSLDCLVCDLLEWIASRQRTYEEVMDAWRTSCPQLPVWEEANDRGLVTEGELDESRIVSLTSAGFAFLKLNRRPTRITSRSVADGSMCEALECE
jgi:D-3-phosphoglycerate dehydrogenase